MRKSANRPNTPSAAGAMAATALAAAVAAALAVAATGAAGCGASASVERKLAGVGVHTVRLENFAGDVAITSWNAGTEMRLRAEISGPDAASVGAVAVTFERTAGTAVATLRAPAGLADTHSEVELDVPPGVTLEVYNRDGAVYVLGSYSALLVRNTNGLVRGYGVNGPVDVENVAGSISLEGDIPHFRVRTDVGRVRIASDLEGALYADSEATVERGRIGVTLPATGKATVDATTKLGRLSTNADLTVLETGDGGTMNGTFGGGGPKLTLRIAAGTVGVWRGHL